MASSSGAKHFSLKKFKKTAFKNDTFDKTRHVQFTEARAFLTAGSPVDVAV